MDLVTANLRAKSTQASYRVAYTVLVLVLVLTPT